MVIPRRSGSGELPEYLILLMNFFLKRLAALSYESGNLIDSFHPLVMAPKNKCKVKKMVKKCKKRH